jgi:hypothetical protein
VPQCPAELPDPLPLLGLTPVEATGHEDLHGAMFPNRSRRVEWPCRGPRGAS